MEKIFNIPWSNSVKIISLITLIIIGVIVYVMVAKAGTVHRLTFVVLGLVLVLLAYYGIQAPMSLKLTEDRLVVSKLFGPKEILYADIARVDVYDGYSSDIRLMGNGGFLGYTGLFRSNQLGKYTAFVGDFKQAFYIRTKAGKTYVVSCENREEAVAVIQGKL